MKSKKDILEDILEPCITFTPDAVLPPSPEPPSITEEDQAQIINCLENSINIVNTHTPFVPESEYKGKTGITMRNQQFILDAINYSQQFPTLRPPNLDITNWINNLSRYNIFIVIWRISHSLERLCWRAVRIFATRSFSQFRQYFTFIRAMSKNGDRDAQTIFEDLNRLYANYKGQRTTNSTGDDVLEEEINIVKNISGDIRRRADNLLRAEKSLQEDLKHNINHQEDILEGK